MNVFVWGQWLKEFFLRSSSAFRYCCTSGVLLCIVLLWNYAIYRPCSTFLTIQQHNLALKTRKKEALLKRFKHTSSNSELLAQAVREIRQARLKLPAQWKDGSALLSDLFKQKHIPCHSQKLQKRKSYQQFKLASYEYGYQLSGTYDALCDLFASVHMQVPRPYCEYFSLRRGENAHLTCDCSFSFLAVSEA